MRLEVLASVSDWQIKDKEEQGRAPQCIYAALIVFDGRQTDGTGPSRGRGQAGRDSGRGPLVDSVPPADLIQAIKKQANTLAVLG